MTLITTTKTTTRTTTMVENKNNKNNSNYSSVRAKSCLITSVWYYVVTNLNKVSRLCDSIMEIQYRFQKFWISKKLRKKLSSKEILNDILDCIHLELQGSKNSPSARYFCLCLKLAINEVSCLHDSIRQTWFGPNWATTTKWTQNNGVLT